MPVFNNVLAGAAGSGGSDYTIERSLRLNSDNSAYLGKTFSSAGNTTTWTLSFWIKRAKGSGNHNILMSYNGSSIAEADYANIQFNTSDQLVVGYAYGAYKKTTRVFRDFSSWYSIVVRVQTGNPTASERVQIWVNGVKETSFSATHDPDLNQSLAWNKAHDHRLGSELNQFYSDCYLADVIFLDGIAVSNPDGVFGEFDATTGVWKPIEYTGSYNATGTGYFSSESGTPYGATRGYAALLDGSTSTSTAAAAGQTYTINFNTITNITSLRIWGKTVSGTGTFLVNGNDYLSSLPTHFGGGYTNGAWFTVPETSLSSIQIGTQSNGYEDAQLYKIEINGTDLVEVPSGVNGFYLDFSDYSSNASLGNDAAGSNNWSVNNLTAFIPAVDVGGDPTVSSSDKPFTTGHSVAFDGNDKLRVQGPGTVSGDFTWECWLKFTGTPSGRFFSAEESVNSTDYSLMRFYSGNLNVYCGDGGGYIANTYSGTVSADTWHHIAMVRHGSTVSHYLDGSRWDTNTFSNSFNITTLVLAQGYGGEYFTGSISNARFVNGQALYTGASYTVPTATLTTTSQSATASNVTTLVAHKASVTANDGTRTGIGGSPSNIDSLIDTPTNYESSSGNNGGCYCTLNPLKSRLTLSNGNLDSTSPTGWKGAAGTIPMSSGKWYWEIDNVVGNEHVVGIVKYNTANVTWNTTYGYGAEVGVKYLATGGVSYGAAWTTGDVIGVAFDADNGVLEFYKNGTSQGVAATGLTDGPYLPSMVHNGTSRSASINFGQRPWQYTPKANHIALCTTNLPEPTISDGSTAFDAITYLGNGSSKTISGVGFSPDFIWTKCRNQARSHYLMDTVRGISKYLITDQTGAEGTNTTNRILSVTSDGWTLGTNNSFNGNNDSYIAWTWDAADSDTTISAGGLNSSAYDQSQTWTNQVSGTENSSYPFSNVFNADGQATHAYPANGTEAVFTPNPSFSNATTVKIWYYAPSMGTNGIKLNGTGVGDQLPTTSGTLTKTFDVTGTGFTSLAWSKGLNSTDSGILRIDVDGKQLVDTSVTVTNVPTVTTTVRANPTAGFSIVNASVAASLTGGPTLAHQLNKKPEFIIGKNRDYGIYWYAYHKDLTNNHYLIPHLDNAEANSSAVWGSHDSLDSNVFQIGSGSPASMWIPSGTHNCIFYVWTSIDSYSSFGSFIGNGSSDGVFVALSFRPRWILVKSKSGVGNWRTYDSARRSYNVKDNSLHLNTNEDETAYGYDDIDFLSNGFKARSTGSYYNGNNTEYIYAAFAENPFKIARAA